MLNDPTSKPAQVVDLFSVKPRNKRSKEQVVRISLENDGWVMLYSNDANPTKLFSIKIIGWGLQADGKVIGLVPWLNKLMACPALHDPLNGRWEGYFNPLTGKAHDTAPAHKKVELEAANSYYRQQQTSLKQAVIQEIPDVIGTHAVLIEAPGKLKIAEVFSWRLLATGEIQGMLVDQQKVERTPILLGDPCLYPAQPAGNFKYFFQYRIANRIKQEDPDALKAITLLISR